MPPAFAAQAVVLPGLNKCLVNLPASLVAALDSAGTLAQDVVVELSFSIVPRPVFAGWTGMASTTSTVNGGVGSTTGFRVGSDVSSTVEIGAAFARLIALSDRSRVDIRLHSNPKDATRVWVEPLTPADWDMLSLRAGFLESEFLSQIRVVPNPSGDRDGADGSDVRLLPHAVPLHLSPTVVANVRVVRVEPDAGDARFVRVAVGGEVVVAPKTDPNRRKKGREGSVKSSKSVRTAGKTTKTTKIEAVFVRAVDASTVDVGIADPGGDLRIFLDPVLVDGTQLAGSGWVRVAISMPKGLVELDPDADDRPKVASSVVARVVRWPDGPSELTAAVSPALATALLSPGMVGEMVRVEPASAPMPKPSALKGGRESGLRTVRIDPFGPYTVGEPPGLAVLDGAVTDGMVVPAADDFPGGIVRFDQSVDGPGWFVGADRRVGIDVGVETSEPKRLSRPGLSILPAPELVGAEGLVSAVTTHLKSHLSVLITGGLGAGKTAIARAAAKAAQDELAYVVFVSCASLTESPAGIAAVLDRAFRFAAWGARIDGRAVVVLDDLDRIAPAETEADAGPTSQAGLVVASTVIRLATRFRPGRVGLVATARSKAGLHSLLGPRLLQEVVDVAGPDKAARRRLLAWMADRRPDGLFGPDPTVDFLALAGLTDGLAPADLVVVMARARREAVAAGADRVGQVHFTAALNGFTPAGLRNVALQKPTVSWSAVGGLADTRRVLLETIEYPTAYAPVFAACPLRLRSGLLLYGYPGCGKTLLASAVASESGLNFISVKGPEMLNKYIGASEQAVRDLFRRAESARPCVLFFDEFDSIAPKRGHDSTGVTDRVVNQLLTLMDGAEGLQGVYVLAATSRPDLIDSALLRPGRLDRSLLCGMPDQHDRSDILTKLSRDVRLGKDVDGRMDELANRTDGFSGADLQGLVQSALVIAIRDFLDAESASTDGVPSSAVGQPTPSVRPGTGVADFSVFRINGNDGLTDRAEAATKLAEISARKAEQGRRASRRAGWDRLGDRPVLGIGRRASGGFDLAGLDRGDLQTDSPAAVETGQPVVMWDHFERAMLESRPSISLAERRRFDAIYSDFVGGRTAGMPSAERGTEVGARTTLA